MSNSQQYTVSSWALFVVVESWMNLYTIILYIAGSAIHPVWLAGELVREFLSYKNSETGFRRLSFYSLGRIFIASAAIKIKKVIRDFFFSDLRAGGTKRAGDVTVEILKKKWTKLFTRSIPTIFLMLTVNYAWKWPQKILCGPPWPSFFIDFCNLSSDLARCDRKKTWTRGTHGSQRSRIRHYQAKSAVQKCA